MLESRAPIFGEQLKQWRARRGVSQLQLAMNADTSPRHISFIETGRSNPSREMVMRLAGALDLSLRDSNDLLLAAGFAPAYRESALNDDELGPARHALQFMLDKHEPYPALVMNHRWELLMRNQSAGALFEAAPPPPGDPPSILRWMFEEGGLREYILNWEEVAAHVLSRARREALVPHADDSIQALFRQLAEDGDISHAWLETLSTQPPAPMLSMQILIGANQTSWFSTIATFGTPRDVTLQELRIETFFPADEFTEQFAQQVAGQMRKQRPA